MSHRKGLPNITVQEYTAWEAEVEESRLDQSILQAEQIALENRIKQSIVPQIGHLSAQRPDSVWRIMYCQVNCLGLSLRDNCKARGISQLIHDYEVDAVALCEVGIDWHYGHRRPQLKDYFDPLLDRECRTTTAFNERSPHVSRAQQGGTGILLTHSILEYGRHCEQDPRRLGRWTSWVLSHNPTHRVRLVIAYCPGKSKPKGPKTVYWQHMNHIHIIGKDTSPYQMFADDLARQLKIWRRAGDRIILCMDANEHVLRGPLAKRFQAQDIELTEATHTFWPSNTEPNTHIDGKLPIDGIFVTPDVDVTNFLSLSFHESIGDHRTMIIEVTTSSVIGRYQGKIVQPSTRRLTLRQHGAVASYNKSLHSQLSLHNIPQRIASLRSEIRAANKPIPDSLAAKCESIHKQIGQIRIHAERTCRKIARPALEFSPPVQYWYDRAHAYKALIRLKSNQAKYIDASRVMRMAHRKGIKNPRTITIEQCKDGLAACKLRQNGLRQIAGGLRQQFTEQQLIAAQRHGDVAREKAIKERMMHERNKKLWKQINKATKPIGGRACLEVQVHKNNAVETFQTKEEVEDAIQSECENRFWLGHNAPIASTLLGDELQYLHNTEIAYAIINGEYSPPHFLDSATKMILREIGKLGKEVTRGTNKTISITSKDYQCYWNRMNEKTSSSPSGIHIAHYKASAKDPILSQTFADQMNLIIESGIHPRRWGNALQVMLEKVAGICLVDKLRSIQLYEADLNWYMKFIFNDIALEKLNALGLLPEEHYSRKGSTAEDACLEKTLTLDISRQSRTPMALISVDAAQCYDRVHPILMSLVWLALVENFHVVVLLLTVLQQMRIYTRTGFGDSVSFFGGPDSSRPLCGLGQGSKAAPASWLQLSSMIVNAFKSAGLSSSIIDPITGTITKSVGCLFVDDTDLYGMDHEIQKAARIMELAQLCVDVWSALLRATGGDIKGLKSFMYLLSYICENGIWRYETKKEQRLVLYLSTDNGKQPLQRKEFDEAERTLGVFHCPSGGHAHHLAQLSNKGTRWVNNMKNASLPSGSIMKSYLFQLWSGLRYGLGTLTNSIEAANACLSNIDAQLLPLLGVNRNITTEWRTLPPAYGGVGLLSLSVEQLISRINIFSLHFGEQTIIGQKLLCSLHLLQLQIGTNINPLTLPYEKWGHLAPISWITRFWESISLQPSILLVIEFDEIPFPRVHDVLVMSVLQEWTVNKEKLQRLNRCRCYLNVLFLSDITLADGRTIDPAITTISPIPKRSKYKFPPERPTRLDWVEWSYAWRSILGRHNILARPLGARTHVSHIHWDYLYHPVTDTLVETSETGNMRMFSRIHDTRSTRSGSWYREISGPIPLLTDETVLYASCTKVRPSPTTQSTHWRALMCSGPSVRQNVEQIPSFWDRLWSLGGTWMWSNLHLNGDDSIDWIVEAYKLGTLKWVTDGSHDPKRAPNISGAGWIVFDTQTSRKWKCSFVEYSPHASSYRAELLGLYSIHVFIGVLTAHHSIGSTHSTTIYCDNERALDMSSKKNLKVRAGAKCADILRAFKTLHRSYTTAISYKHVAAHMDDKCAWDDLSIEQQLNVECDTLAKQAVAAAIRRMCESSREVDISSQLLPGERCAIIVQGIKQTSDPGPAVRLAEGTSRAKSFFTMKKGWSPEQFHNVAWDALDDMLHTKPPGYRIWLTKQQSGFCATGVQMKRWFGAENDRCPNCLSPAERADHLCRCPSEERTQLLHDSTADLEKWMRLDDNTYHEILYLVPKYILCRGTIRFADLGSMSPTMMEAAKSQDVIGWRNFMEGRISKRFFTIQHSHISTSHTTMTLRGWSRKFISLVLQITHSQWLFRNFSLHDTSTGLLRTRERAHTGAMIDSLMELRPVRLPPESRFLLEFDTEGLHKSNTDTQHYWIAAVEASIHAGATRTSTSHRMWDGRTLRARLGASKIIKQIREEAKLRVSAQGWVQQDSSITSTSPGVRRPTHEAAALHHGSRKKHKPD